jgi:hypothetical protein
MQPVAAATAFYVHKRHGQIVLPRNQAKA